MREGYYLNSDEKHLYLLDSKRTPIECLTNLIENLNHINIFNGTGEMSFVIYYSDETKHIYNAFIEKMTHLRLEDYGEFIVDTAPENIQGEVRYKTVTCKDEEYMLNKRLLTLVNNTASFFSGVLWTTDTSVPCVMREFFNEVPSWSIGTVDSEIDTTKKSFRDIKKQNMLKFVYENIEQAFDCIPFFDSLNRTISFRKTKNAIDDTGIVASLSNFIDSIVKESINDTFCTRMYTEGGNLDIRRVNPDGRNYVYYYETFYNLMSDELVNHLKNYLKAIDDNKIGYQTAFADWSEAKTKYDEASAIQRATDAEMIRWNDRYFILDKNGATQEEKDLFFSQWAEWSEASGRRQSADDLAKYGPIMASKKTILDNINSLCNVKNFLTTSDFIELDQFETEGSYKQEAFAYIKGMSEAEKGDIAQILKTYATEEIARCNSPRYTYNVSLSNFCTIEGCEYFAESLDVGKYITLYDDVTGESVKLIVVKIETDKENPKDLKLTFSDKMSGHEKFATLNEYLNNAIKNMDDIEKTNVRIDEIETVVDSVMNKQEVLETSVSTLYENYQASSFNIEAYKSPNLQTTSKNPIGAINEVFQSTTNAFNTFATSIKSKGGTVSKAGTNYTKTEVNNGILSIAGGSYGEFGPYFKTDKIYLKSVKAELLPDGINSNGNYPYNNYIKYAEFWMNVFSYSFMENIKYYTQTEDNSEYLYVTADYGTGNLQVVLKVLKSGNYIFPTFNDNYLATLSVIDVDKTLYKIFVNTDFYIDSTNWVLSMNLITNIAIDNTTKQQIITDRPIEEFRIYFNKNLYNRCVVFSTVQKQIPIIPYDNYGNITFYHIQPLTKPIGTNNKIKTSQDDKIGFLIDINNLNDKQKEILGYNTLIVDGVEYYGIYQTNFYLNGLLYYFHGGGKTKLIRPSFIDSSIVDVYDIIE